MANTLGLDDDLDDVELLQDIETAFKVRITDVEASALYTVGDIYNLLLGRFSSTEATGQCATAMAFYRLRSAFSDLGDRGAVIRPRTPIHGLAPLPAKALFKQISVGSGLMLPRPWSTRLGVIGALSLAAGALSVFLPAVFGLYLWPVPALLIAVGIALIHRDPKKVPADCQTLGELSRRVAGFNFGELVAEGAAPRAKDVWAALVEVLSESSLLPKSEMRPDTLLLQSQLRNA